MLISDSSSGNFHAMSLSSFPCLAGRSESALVVEAEPCGHKTMYFPIGANEKATGWERRHSRYQCILTPCRRPKNRPFVRPPDGDRSFGSHIPNDNPAFCISGHETAISSDEGCRVNWSSVATKDVNRLRRRQRHRDWLVM